MIIKKYSSINGTTSVPGDKSISHRGVMLGAMANGTTSITGFLNGADCLATIDCFKKLGVDIEMSPEIIKVHGKGMHGFTKPTSTLYTANSGTTTRLMSGILAGQPFECNIDGDASIRKRPMNRIATPLTLMGASFSSEYCPMTVRGGTLTGIDYAMPVASAQVKSALILAGLYANGTTVIHEPAKSRDHTERMLASMGANIIVSDNCVTLHKTDVLSPLDIAVPGDISSAAFLIVAALIMPNSNITIKNVGVNPTRTGLLSVLKDMNANIALNNCHTTNNEPVADINVQTSKLLSTTIGGDIIPSLIDEIPIIAVAAAFAKGRTVIRDAKELKVKESDRINTVVTELKRGGVDITATDDGMIIEGNQNLQINGCDFVSYGDHRIAMSAAVLAQMSNSECTIDDTSCIDVSFPGFFDIFDKLSYNN